MTQPGYILLVEDDRDIRETLAEALGDQGYQVVEAIDGLDALDRLRGAATVPDLIVLDLMMPRMNGAEFRARMLEVDAWRAVPVLVLTADAEARAKAEALRADGFLRKPVGLRDLLGAVTRLRHPT